jgi:carbamoyltransferase
MAKPVYVIGVGLSPHDGSCCLLKDGKIIVAIEKERISKLKRDGLNDTDSIAYCMDAGGINWGDVSLVVQNSVTSNLRKDWFYGPRYIPSDVQVVTISHHLAHAYSAYYLSGFEETAIFITDASGNEIKSCTDLNDKCLLKDAEGLDRDFVLETNSYYKAVGDEVTALCKEFTPLRPNEIPYTDLACNAKNSIGQIYSEVNSNIFGMKSDRGKLMGLSSYGKNNLFSGPLFSLEDGAIKVNAKELEILKAPPLSYEEFKNSFEYYADLAYSVQKNVEDILIKIINNRYPLYPHDNLCYAGGLALNAVANTRIRNETPFKNIFIPPPAYDGGISVGCAYYGWAKVLGMPRAKASSTVFFGRGYEGLIKETVKAVAKERNDIRIYLPTELNVEVAKLLTKGKAIGWYKGGSEFGPRALGHRSILGDPREPKLRDYINNQVKFREDFRPFAPSVIAEEADTYFDIDFESPHMLFVVPVQEEWRNNLGAVTHVDGTARVQTVRKEDNPEFYDLLCEFKKLTGVGMVINTSFNRKGEPIVEEPIEAVRVLCDTGMHGLVLGPYLLVKN